MMVLFFAAVPYLLLPMQPQPTEEVIADPKAGLIKLVDCLDDALRTTCEQAKAQLEYGRKYGYEGIDYYAKYKDDCLELGVDLGGEIPDQILTWDSTYTDHTGYRTWVRAWKYAGPDYETYTFVDEQGAPVLCTSKSFNHEKKSSRCYLEITEPQEERT